MSGEASPGSRRQGLLAPVGAAAPVELALPCGPEPCSRYASYVGVIDDRMFFSGESSAPPAVALWSLEPASGSIRQETPFPASAIDGQLPYAGRSETVSTFWPNRMRASARSGGSGCTLHRAPTAKRPSVLPGPDSRSGSTGVTSPGVGARATPGRSPPTPATSGSSTTPMSSSRSRSWTAPASTATTGSTTAHCRTSNTGSRSRTRSPARASGTTTHSGSSAVSATSKRCPPRLGIWISSRGTRGAHGIDHGGSRGIRGFRGACSGRGLPARPRRLRRLPGSCIPSTTSLCLLEGRFEVEAAWTDFAGHSGIANVQQLTPDTGYFWFFDEANVEVVAKLVDGSAFNRHFWVYYGALSNVEYTLTVTDTVAGGPPKIYRNPLGQFGSFGDIEAFPAP